LKGKYSRYYSIYRIKIDKDEKEIRRSVNDAIALLFIAGYLPGRKQDINPG